MCHLKGIIESCMEIITINTTILKLPISVSIYVFMIQDVFCNLTYKNHLANCRRTLRQAIVQFLFLIRSSDM